MVIREDMPSIAFIASPQRGGAIGATQGIAADLMKYMLQTGEPDLQKMSPDS